MKNYLLPAVCLAAIVGAGVLHGHWTRRWAVSTEMYERAAQLKNLPVSFGDWIGVSQTITENEIRQTETVGYYSVNLTNRNGGPPVNIMLLCGRAGTLATHPPTTCFQGRGREATIEEPRKVRILGPDSSADWGALNVNDFQSTEMMARSRDRLFWGWSRDGIHWESPVNPRLHFAGATYLYKIYILRPLESGEKIWDPKSTNSADPEDFPNDRCAEMAREFFPLLKSVAEQPLGKFVDATASAREAQDR